MNKTSIFEKMHDFYNTNADFRRYIDDNAKGYGKDYTFILQTQIAREYYKSMQKGGCNEAKQMDFGYNPWQE